MIIYCFSQGDLQIHGTNIVSGINSYNSVIRLNELITLLASDK